MAPDPFTVRGIKFDGLEVDQADVFPTPTETLPTALLLLFLIWRELRDDQRKRNP